MKSLIDKTKQTANTIQSLRIGLASPEKIINWSHGEVKKPETFNYRTYKPEKDGLFCERIFGPVKDFECACGKYKKKRYKGIFCERCGVEVTSNRVRRERLGHIRLASPVAHIWFTKSIPNRFSAMLGISGKEIEKVVYFVNWLVIEVDDKWVLEKGNDIEALVNKYLTELDDEKRELKNLEQINLFEIAKGGDVEATRKREITMLQKSLEDAPPDFEDEKVQEKLDSVKDILLSQELLKPFMIAEPVVDPDTNETIAVPQDRFTFALLSKLFYIGCYDVTVENIEMEIEATKRIEEIDETTKSLNRAVELIKTVKPLDRLNDQQREDYNALRSLCLIRDMGDLDEHFHVGIGAQAIQETLRQLNMPELERQLTEELETATSQKKQKLIKRLKVVRAFINSGNRPDWMILTVLPVLPPELRPMVELEGGRFASSDLNDLYRRVINRNNRLKKLIDIRAPESILRNERRMLQEAVDALIDNGRKGRAAVNVNNRALKSLSDMLKGKQGRFRQNLLGKRVDYSGRSVIVVGPRLKLHQCGLPKYMALELFKPFVLNKLISPDDPNQNIAHARRTLERAEDPRVWDALEEITRNHPVLLNRAPTLHRLSIQAFEPVLIEGKAIQLHPLVCAAYNADFDGDQMAVHVPLSIPAQAEARLLMLSSNNLLLPADGKPIISPTHDVVLGVYYITQTHGVITDHSKLPAFLSINDALIAYQHGHVKLQDQVRVPIDIPVLEKPDFSLTPVTYKGLMTTTPGRMIFNDVIRTLMEEMFEDIKSFPMPYINSVIDKGGLSALIANAFQTGGQAFTVRLADAIKDLGFEMATQSGLTISASDIVVPEEKVPILEKASSEAADIWSKRKKGVITEFEKDMEVTRIWDQATKDLSKAMRENFDTFNSLYMMATSGARGKMDQVRQLAAMRGLLVGPTGRVLDFPIKSNFREGLSVFEYFISTHGGRKGLVDTALKTADSGYLTRRLIDVALDVSVTEEDCHTTQGIALPDPLVPHSVSDSSISGMMKQIMSTTASMKYEDRAALARDIFIYSRRKTFSRNLMPFFEEYVRIREELDTNLQKNDSIIQRMSKNSETALDKANTLSDELDASRVALQNHVLQVSKFSQDVKKLLSVLSEAVEKQKEEVGEVIKDLPKNLQAFSTIKTASGVDIDKLGRDASESMDAAIKYLGKLKSRSKAAELKEKEAVRAELVDRMKETLKALNSELGNVEGVAEKASEQNDKAKALRNDTITHITVLDRLARELTARQKLLEEMSSLEFGNALEMPFTFVIEDPGKEITEDTNIEEYAQETVDRIKSSIVIPESSFKKIESWKDEVLEYAREHARDYSSDIMQQSDQKKEKHWLAASIEETVESLPKKFEKVYLGRLLAEDFVVDMGDGPEIILPRGTDLHTDDCRRLLVACIRSIVINGIGSYSIKIRSTLTCRTLGGVCSKCYGWDLASGNLAQVGDPVGVIAAQSIGEPGTQLTMRTFHTGGIKGRDITQGLPYVETLFEVRGVKNPSILAEEDGEVVSITEMVYDRVTIQSPDGEREKIYEVVHPYDERLKIHYRSTVAKGDALDESETVFADFNGIVTQLFTDSHKTYWRITIRNADGMEREYETPHENRTPRVIKGQRVNQGDQLCDGDMDIRKLHILLGDLPTQQFIANEIQDIYEKQNVNTNSKHIEVVTKQMIRFVEVTDPAGEDNLFEGDLVDRNFFNQLVEQRLEDGQEPPKGRSLLQGISKSSLSTESFLAAASFQETTRVLTEAAIEGKVDNLHGLKENVIIGGLIPVGTGRLMSQIEEMSVKELFPVIERDDTAEEKPTESVF